MDKPTCEDNCGSRWGCEKCNPPPSGPFTCDECYLRFVCRYAWDFYNTNGDCLAEK